MEKWEVNGQKKYVYGMQSIFNWTEFSSEKYYIHSFFAAMK